MRRLLLPLLLAVLLILAACGNGSGPSSTNRGPSSTNGGSGSQQGLTTGNAYNPCPSHPNTTAAPPESGSITLTVAGFTCTSYLAHLFVKLPALLSFSLHFFGALT